MENSAWQTGNKISSTGAAVEAFSSREARSLWCLVSGVWCCDTTPKCAFITQYIWKMIRYGFLGLLASVALVVAITANDLSMKLRIASFGFGFCALFIATAIYTGKRSYLILSILLLVASVMVPIIVAALH